MAFARSFNTLNGIAKAVIQISTRGRLLLRPQKRTGEGPVHSPISRHHQQPKHAKANKQTKTKTTQKTKQTTNKKQQQRNNWLPVHWRIHAKGDNIVSSHYGMATNITKKGRTQTHTRPYTQVRAATQHHAEPGIPQPGSPRSYGTSRKA